MEGSSCFVEGRSYFPIISFVEVDHAFWFMEMVKNFSASDAPSLLVPFILRFYMFLIDEVHRTFIFIFPSLSIRGMWALGESSWGIAQEGNQHWEMKELLPRRSWRTLIYTFVMNFYFFCCCFQFGLIN